MNVIRNATLAVMIAVPAFVTLPGTVDASLIPWQWSGTVVGLNVAGQAEFDVVGGTLVITLENTALVQPGTTAQVLTGLLFDISGLGSALGMQSATADDGIVNAASTTATDAGLNICAAGVGGTALANTCGSTLGGGWEAGYWAAGAVPGEFDQHYGIGTAGLGLFNGNATTGVGNANYGVVPSVGTTALDGLEGMDPYSYKVASFVLQGASALPGTITISNVQALYGTSLDDIRPPNIVPPADQPIAEPSSVALLGIGCLGLVLVSRKRSH